MATFFKKPRRNFRGRQVTADEDSNDDDNSNDVEGDQNEEGPVIVKKEAKQKKKKKDTIERNSSVLSFDDFHADEGDTFKIKKSSHSKRIAKQLKKESQKDIVKGKDTDHESDTERNGSPLQREDSQEDREEKIRRLREEFLTLNGEDAEAMDSEEEAEDKASISKMMKRGEIPDANMIHMIRKKRQQARDLGDFIPVDDTEKYENTKSRLVRDDDNDKSDDDDEDSRMDFSVNKHARDRIKMQNEFLAAEHGSDNEDSDRDREWEEQQIRKGVSLGPEVSDISQSTSALQLNQFNGYQSQDTYSNGQTTFQPFTSMAGTGQQVTMDAIRKRLKERLDSLDEVHRRHVSDRDTLVTDIDDTEKSIASCEDRVKGLEERYCFFQEMRGYVRDLVECLNEKVPRINDLEQRMLSLWRNRALKLLNRRQQDVRDQCQDYLTNKAQLQMEHSEAQARQRRVAEREARRARRRRARENKDIVGHHDGLSSDDEENQSEVAKFTVEKDSIEGALERVFEDVVEDFSEVQSVRGRFEKWKYTYDSTYTDAYIGLCLPKLYNPFVRLQLIQWNPLEENCRDFEETGWFETLVFYGFKRDDTICKEDDDVRLLPNIVEKVLLPRITTIAETIWDPLSTTQTARLVNLLQRISKDYPTVHAGSKNTQNMLHAITKRMQKTLDDDVFMPLYPKTAIENRSAGPSIFFHRQLWTCIKLLGNILSWHGILSSTVLQGLALDGLLNRYIILGLCNSVINSETLQKCQSIISTFPKEWFSLLDDEQTMPQLENLAKYLVSAANTIYNESQQQREMEKKESKEHIRQISKMLVNIHAMEKAANLPH